jgi:hypothetical protein
MNESRTIKMDDIRKLLELKAYEVDPEAVAAAIVERLLAGRTTVAETRP